MGTFLRWLRGATQGLAWAMGMSLGLSTAAMAQGPDQAAFEAAVQAVRPTALALGLSLRTDGLWSALLQRRVPMLALRIDHTCHIGYSAYTPGQDFSTLFPTLPPGLARVWLEGLVQHELAHCAQTQAPAAAAPWAGSRGRLDPGWARKHEARADLAFALHVSQAHPDGKALIVRLLGLREMRARHDPVHDSSAELRCFLALSGNEAAPAAAQGQDGVAFIAAWRGWVERCLLAGDD